MGHHGRGTCFIRMTFGISFLWIRCPCHQSTSSHHCQNILTFVTAYKDKNGHRNSAYALVSALSFYTILTHWTRINYCRINAHTCILTSQDQYFLWYWNTRGATVTGCAPVVSWLYQFDKQSSNARKNTERLKFQDFNICPHILHVDAGRRRRGYSNSSSALKCRRAKNKCHFAIKLCALVFICVE